MNIIKSDIIQLKGVANSMQGGRQENQDDMIFLDTPLGFLAIICDGMGGGPGGKTASYIAKYEISNTLCEFSQQTSIEHAFKVAASRAQDAMQKKMQEMPSLQGMGSTFVAVLINRNSAFIAHAGDSRCYLLRGKKCIYRSQDHSLVAELVRKKALTEEEARLSPQSNVISRGLGSTSNNVPEIEEIPYKTGDRIILCTDGVWGMMQHKELLKRFIEKKDLQQLVSNLSSEIDNIGNSKGGHHDNHTIAVFDLECTSILKPKTDWKRFAIFCSLAFTLLAVIAFIVLLVSRKSTTYNNEGIVSGSYNNIAENNYTSKESSKPSYERSDNTEEKYPGHEENMAVIRNNTDSIIQEISQKQERSKTIKTEQHNDSIGKSKDVTSSQKALETTQKLINRYKTAISVEGKTIDETKKELNDLHTEINSLMSQLKDLCKENAEALSKAESIGRCVDNANSWYVDKTPDKSSGKFKPTTSAQEYMKKQIVRLTELKKSI